MLVIILSVNSGMMKKKERLCPHFSVVYRPKKVDILTKTQNRVGLTVVNVCAVKNTLQLHENVVQNYIANGISSSAATLKALMEGL